MRKPLGKSPLGSSIRRWEGIVQIDLRDMD
jgi:hypothetical protein